MPALLAAGCLAVCAIMPFRGELLALSGIVVLLLLLAAIVPLHLGRVSLPLSVLPFVMWTVLSFVWSIAPLDSMIGSGKTSALFLVAVILTAGRSMAEVIDVFGLASKVVLLVTWVVAVTLPSVGRTQESHEQGSIEGLFVHRNLLGYFAVLATVTFVVQLVRPHQHWTPRLRQGAWALLGVATIIGANSRTGWVVAVAMVMLALCLRAIAAMRAPRATLASTAAILAAVAVTAAATQYASFVGYLGRDATLTGRTTIWSAVTSAIAERPGQGYGWNAVWLTGSPLAAELSDKVGFTFYHSHNGYLDIALQIGVVGAAFAVALLALVFARSVRAFLGSPSLENYWCVLILSVIATYNLSESVAFNNLGWVMLAALALKQADAIPRVVSDDAVSRYAGRLEDSSVGGSDR